MRTSSRTASLWLEIRFAATPALDGSCLLARQFYGDIDPPFRLVGDVDVDLAAVLAVFHAFLRRPRRLRRPVVSAQERIALESLATISENCVGVPTPNPMAPASPYV